MEKWWYEAVFFTNLSRYSLTYRQFVGVLHFAKYEEGIEGADAVYVAEDAEDKLLVGFHVLNVDLEF